MSIVKTRRSIHRFKPDPVSDEYIEKIIEAARWAPSGYNLQPWEFVVIKDQKLKADIIAIASPSSSNIKRTIKEATARGTINDLTHDSRPTR